MSTTITIVVDGPSVSAGATTLGDDAEHGPPPTGDLGGQQSQAESAVGAGPPPRPEIAGPSVAGGSAGLASGTESAPAPSLDLAENADGEAAAASGPAPEGGALDAAEAAGPSAAPEPVALEDLD